MNISVHHNLSNKDAKVIIDNLISDLKNKYGSLISKIIIRWDSDKCFVELIVYNFNIRAQLQLLNNKVSVDLNLPFLLNFRTRQIYNEAYNTLNKYLN